MNRAAFLPAPDADPHGPLGLHHSSPANTPGQPVIIDGDKMSRVPSGLNSTPGTCRRNEVSASCPPP